MESNFDIYDKLEESGIFIHYTHEHYNDGINLCFSIEFKNQNTQTGWYNDNHEFGGIGETMYKSIQLALWYLEDPKRIELINSGYNNPDYITYVNQHAEFVSALEIKK